jgi:hypothetical protein
MKNNQQWKLTIKIEDDNAWLMDGNMPILGSSGIDALLEELEGIILLNHDNMEIFIINESKLMDMISFTD